jgi:hypothetical protein
MMIKAVVQTLAVSVLLLAPAAVGAADLHPKAVVPHGQTYVFYKGGIKIGTADSGRLLAREPYLRPAIQADGSMTCIKVPCPGSMPANTTCWNCTWN